MSNHTGDDSGREVPVRCEALPDVVDIKPDVYYTERAAAALLGVSLETMRRNRRVTTVLPFCRYGRRVFYRGSDLIEMLDGSRVRRAPARWRHSTLDEKGHAA